MSLMDIVSRGNKQINEVNNGSLLVASRDKKIASLKAKIAEMEIVAGKAESLLAKQINVIDRFNLETVGSTTERDNTLAHTAIVETTVEAPLGYENVTRTEAVDYSVQFSKANGKQSARITLGQYDPIYRFYVIHPTSNLTIELNGIPNAEQRHEIGGLLATLFDNLKEGANKNALRTIRTIEDQESTGKLLTCGRVWPRRNCKCNDEETVKTEETVETALDELLDVLPVATNEDLDYLNNLLGNKPAEENKVDKAKTKRELFFSSHDPAKGTEQGWRFACKAIRISAAKGIGHSGYLDRKYDSIVKIALASDKISAELLARD